MPASAAQGTLHVDVIRQFPGPAQVLRAVKVMAPGKHFTGLQPAERREFYEATAVEFKERHNFPAHHRAWGAAHQGPGIRFVCPSDAMDDPTGSTPSCVPPRRR